MAFGFGAAELLLIALFYSGIGLPLGVPPEVEDPLLQRVAPAECLYFTTWAGMAKADGASANQTEALLAEPEVQRMASEIDRLFAEGLVKIGDRARDPGEAYLAKIAPLWAHTLLTHPTAIFLSDLRISPDGPPDIEAGAVINTGDDTGKIQASLLKLQVLYLKDKVEQIEIVGTKCYRFQLDEQAPEITWCIKGKYLLVGLGKGSLEKIFDNVRQQPPAWLTDIKKQLPVERVSSVTYSNLQASIAAVVEGLGPDGAEVERIIKTLGLGNMTTYAAVTGLDKDGFVNRTLIRVEGEGRGLLMLVDGKPLTAADLAPIPADANVAMALRLDADKAVETGLSLAKEIDPRAAEQIDEGLAQLNQMLGLDLREDVTQALGDVWCVYNSPEEGGTFFTGLTATVSLRDHAKTAKAEKQLLALAEAALRGPDGPDAYPDSSPKLKHITLGEHTIHYFTGGQMPLAPAWCLTKTHLVVSLLPQNVQAYLARDASYRSIAGNPSLAPLIAAKEGPLAVTYVDTKQLFEMLYPLGQMLAQTAFNQMQREGIEIDAGILPMSQSISGHLLPSVASVRRTAEGIEFTREQSLPGSSAGSTTPVTLALLLPAVQAARSAAQRAQSTNNLKQIALAHHNHDSAFGNLPAAAMKTKEGKPGLSWRVKILPFIEEQALYDLFRHDEPWDSEHNKKLLEKMPAVYRSPASRAAPGMTNYLGVAGKSGMFPIDGDGTGIADVRDGLSNTILLLEVDDARAVPWTKPEDFEPDGMKPLGGLGGLWRSVFLVALGDGSVRAVSNSIDEKVFAALLTKSGGEAVRLDDFDGAAPPRRPDFDALEVVPEESAIPEERIERIPERALPVP